MTNTVILIPSHLRATRLPNKPLLLINNKAMIVHCWQRAIDSKIGEVYVATADEEIAKVIKDVGGKSILTSKEHKTGSDRIFEAIEKNFSKKPSNIINLQGDMPNIDPSAIKLLDKFINNNSYQIATLATKLNSIKDLEVWELREFLSIYWETRYFDSLTCWSPIKPKFPDIKLDFLSDT